MTLLNVSYFLSSASGLVVNSANSQALSVVHKRGFEPWLITLHFSDDFFLHLDYSPNIFKSTIRGYGGKKQEHWCHKAKSAECRSTTQTNDSTKSAGEIEIKISIF